MTAGPILTSGCRHRGDCLPHWDLEFVGRQKWWAVAVVFHSEYNSLGDLMWVVTQGWNSISKQ